jgi:hypothetical protein
MTILCSMFYVICLVLVLFCAAYALSFDENGKGGYQPTRDLTRSGQERPPLPRGGSAESGRNGYRVDTSEN